MTDQMQAIQKEIEKHFTPFDAREWMFVSEIQEAVGVPSRYNRSTRILFGRVLHQMGAQHRVLQGHAQYLLRRLD